MVPDVKYNEAYISFVLVHPEWRRGGIGTYMIYHLIQTCMGKDVTLHVSVTNPAMLLYQKFGFKPEEFILDFYSKYLPEDSSQCRHAYFLRLRRWIIYLWVIWWFMNTTCRTWDCLFVKYGSTEDWTDYSMIQNMLWFDIVICILTATWKSWITEWLWSEYTIPNCKQGYQPDETWTMLTSLKSFSG